MASKRDRGRLTLNLRGGSETKTVELDLIGTKASGPLYLAAYDTEYPGRYRGHADGKRLLRWLENAAKRVRANMEHAQERSSKQKRGR